MANLKRINEYMNVGTVYSDFERIENYIELFRAIVDGKYDLNGLFDYQEEQKRVAELDAMYARGELPPLAKQFKKKNTISKRGKKSYSKEEHIRRNKMSYVDRAKKVKVGSGGSRNRKGVILTDLLENKVYDFKTKKELEEFLATKTDEKIYLKKINEAIDNEISLLDRYRIEEKE